MIKKLRNFILNLRKTFLDDTYIFKNLDHKWDKVFKNGPSKICGKQPLKTLNGYVLPKADHTPSKFLKTVLHKFYLVHSWILCPKCSLRLSFDNANHILAHLSGTTFNENVMSFDVTSNVTEKEKFSSLSYLSGCFFTFNKRIRFPKTGERSTFYYQQRLLLFGQKNIQGKFHYLSTNMWLY